LTIEIFTDGSTSPRNPGYGGAASVILFNDQVIINADYINRRVTSNYTELTAIKRAMEVYKETIGDMDEEVILYSDSNYSLGVIAGEYAPRKNRQIIQEIIKLRNTFNNIRYFWIRSHRNISSAKDEKTRKIIDWNNKVDNIAGITAKKGKKFSYSETMSIKKFREGFITIKR